MKQWIGCNLKVQLHLLHHCLLLLHHFNRLLKFKWLRVLQIYKLHADEEKVIFCLKGIHLLFLFWQNNMFSLFLRQKILCSLYIDFYYLSLMGQLPWNCLVLYIVFTSFMLFTVTEQKFFILYMHCNLGIPKFCIVVTSPQTAMQLLHYFGMAAMCCVLLLTTLMATQLLINLICQV